PLGPGFGIQVLRTDERTGHFTVMIRAEAGSVLPRHKHLGAAEIYILSGKGVHPQTGAFSTGDYIFEEEGAIHDEVHFAETCDMLMVNYGPSAFLTPDNQPTYRMDIPMLKGLAAAQR
ncbi:unnamed protein product, partial [marine sediment metagenome]